MKKPVTNGTIIYQFVLTCQIDGMEAFPKKDIRVWGNCTKYFVDLRNLFVLMKVEAELHIIMKFEYQISFVNVPLAFKLQCTVCIKLMLAFHFPS